jgi:hypothetical protein
MNKEEIASLRKGNVIKTPYDSVLIVTKIDDEKIGWIDPNHSSSSGSIPLHTEKELVTCGCVLFDNPHGLPINDCEYCGGNGEITIKELSLEDCVFLDDNIKDYILNAINLKNIF